MKIRMVLAMLAVLLLVNGALACWGKDCKTSAFGSAISLSNGKFGVDTIAQTWAVADPASVKACADCHYSSSGALVSSFSQSSWGDKALAGTAPTQLNPDGLGGATATAIGSMFATTSAEATATTGTCDDCNYATMSGAATAVAANDLTIKIGKWNLELPITTAWGSASATGTASATGSNPVAYTMNDAGVTLKSITMDNPATPNVNEYACTSLDCKQSYAISESYASTCEDIETPEPPTCTDCDGPA